jgi:hypothetical protein
MMTLADSKASNIWAQHWVDIKCADFQIKGHSGVYFSSVQPLSIT